MNHKSYIYFSRYVCLSVPGCLLGVWAKLNVTGVKTTSCRTSCVIYYFRTVFSAEHKISALFDFRHFLDFLRVYRPTGHEKRCFSHENIKKLSFWTRKYHFLIIIFQFQKFFLLKAIYGKNYYYMRMTVSSTETTVHGCTFNAFIKKSIVLDSCGSCHIRPCNKNED